MCQKLPGNINMKFFTGWGEGACVCMQQFGEDMNTTLIESL